MQASTHSRMLVTVGEALALAGLFSSGSWNGGKCAVQGVETAQKVLRRAGIEIPIVNLTGLSLTAHCSGWDGPFGLIFCDDLPSLTIDVC